MKTFFHSGDMGDVIYSLPTIRAMGGGRLVLDPDGGKDDPFVGDQLRWTKRTRLRFNEKSANFLLPLLNAQTYLNGVCVGPRPDGAINLNRAREHMRSPESMLAHAFALSCGVTIEELKLNEPWIALPCSTPETQITINRNLRYQSNSLFWEMCYPSYHDKWRFIGSDLEHAAFEDTFGPVERCVVTDALDMATEINGADQHWGNQSLPMAIAQGLGKRGTMEVYRMAPNCCLGLPQIGYV
jgi:hypothetical protein